MKVQNGGKIGTFPIIKGGRDVRDAREIDSLMRHICLKIVKKEYDTISELKERLKDSQLFDSERNKI